MGENVRRRGDEASSFASLLGQRLPTLPVCHLTPCHVFGILPSVLHGVTVFLFLKTQASNLQCPFVGLPSTSFSYFVTTSFSL